MHKNIHTGETLNRLPEALYDADGRPNFNPTLEQYHAAGWRDVVNMPTPEGYVRTGWQEPVWNEAADRFERHPVTITQAEHDAQQALRPPEPSAVVLDIDSETGAASGKTYRVLCVDGVLTSTLNSASPELPGTEQIAEAVAKRKKQKAAVGAFGKGQLQQRIEALEAYILAGEQ